MTPIAIAVTLAVVALVFVLAPLVRGGKKGEGKASHPRAGEGMPPLGQAVESPLPDPLEELELDRAMGKLSEADYERLRAAMVTEGARPATATATEALEDAAEALIRAARRDPVSCPRCGDRPEPGAQYCSTCGRPLKACAACGALVEDDGARFCASCGAPLAG